MSSLRAKNTPWHPAQKEKQDPRARVPRTELAKAGPAPMPSASGAGIGEREAGDGEGEAQEGEAERRRADRTRDPMRRVGLRGPLDPS